MASILEGFEVTFGVIFWMCGVTFSMRLRKWKCGLDLLFAVNQAHGHLPTQAEKVRKYVNFGGRFLDALWDGILEHFWHHFGSILGAFWGQNGQKRWSKNRWKKRSEKSHAGVCGCLQVWGLQYPQNIPILESQGLI